MPKNDVVPCFYKGQDTSWERPTRILPRSEVRELKRQKIGRFINNGSAFLFFRTAPATQRAFTPYRVTRRSSQDSPCAISFEEMQANVGIVDDGIRHPGAFIAMSQEKVLLYPHIFDDQAPVAHGSWPSMAR